MKPCSVFIHAIAALLFAMPVICLAEPPVYWPSVVARKAADAMMAAYQLPSDSSFQIRNYTGRDIKTCFYRPDDNVMRIHLGIKGDKDDCVSTPKGKKKGAYGTDQIKWSLFNGNSGGPYSISKHLNARVLKKGKTGIWTTYCTRKNILHPKRLNVLKDGGKCKTTVVRHNPGSYLKKQGITHGRDFLYWEKAHREDISYFIARNADYVYVAFRGTNNDLPANLKLNQDGRPVNKHGASVHNGWWKVTEKAYRYLSPQIRAWAGKPGKNKPILVTGHSLGGALSMYTAFRLMRQGYKDVNVVTFGAPRVDTHTFSAKFNTLARKNGGTIVFVERKDDDVLEAWSIRRKLRGSTPLAGQLFELPEGCKDPHSRDNYYKAIVHRDRAC